MKYFFLLLLFLFISCGNKVSSNGCSKACEEGYECVENDDGLSECKLIQQDGCSKACEDGYECVENDDGLSECKPIQRQDMCIGFYLASCYEDGTHCKIKDVPDSNKKNQYTCPTTNKQTQYDLVAVSELKIYNKSFLLLQEGSANNLDTLVYGEVFLNGPVRVPTVIEISSNQDKNVIEIPSVVVEAGDDRATFVMVQHKKLDSVKSLTFTAKLGDLEDIVQFNDFSTCKKGETYCDTRGAFVCDAKGRSWAESEDDSVKAVCDFRTGKTATKVELKEVRLLTPYAMPGMQVMAKLVFNGILLKENEYVGTEVIAGKDMTIEKGSQYGYVLFTVPEDAKENIKFSFKTKQLGSADTMSPIKIAIRQDCIAKTLTCRGEEGLALKCEKYVWSKEAVACQQGSSESCGFQGSGICQVPELTRLSSSQNTVWPSSKAEDTTKKVTLTAVMTGPVLDDTSLDLENAELRSITISKDSSSSEFSYFNSNSSVSSFITVSHGKMKITHARINRIPGG